MSDLVVIGYPDEATAAKVMDEVEKLEHDYLIDLADAAIITCDAKGKYHVTTVDHAVAAGTLGGMFWGTLIGLIFLFPLGGLVIGGLMGALMGKIGDMGIQEDFKSQVKGLVKPGTSAIFMLIRKETPDRVLAALAPYGGTVLKTSLSDDAEKQLQEALHGEQPATA